jgi:hypothetical protein
MPSGLLPQALTKRLHDLRLPEVREPGVPHASTPRYSSRGMASQLPPLSPPSPSASPLASGRRGGWTRDGAVAVPSPLSSPKSGHHGGARGSEVAPLGPPSPYAASGPSPKAGGQRKTAPTPRRLSVKVSRRHDVEDYPIDYEVTDR